MVAKRAVRKVFNFVIGEFFISPSALLSSSAVQHIFSPSMKVGRRDLVDSLYSQKSFRIYALPLTILLHMAFGSCHPVVSKDFHA